MRLPSSYYFVATYLSEKIFEAFMAMTGVKKGHRIKLSISIEEDNVDWIESQVETQKYRNVSHAIDAILREKRVSESV